MSPARCASVSRVIRQIFIGRGETSWCPDALEAELYLSADRSHKIHA